MEEYVKTDLYTSSKKHKNRHDGTVCRPQLHNWRIGRSDRIFRQIFPIELTFHGFQLVLFDSADGGATSVGKDSPPSAESDRLTEIGPPSVLSGKKTKTVIYSIEKFCLTGQLWPDARVPCLNGFDSSFKIRYSIVAEK